MDPANEELPEFATIPARRPAARTPPAQEPGAGPEPTTPEPIVPPEQAGRTEGSLGEGSEPEGTSTIAFRKGDRSRPFARPAKIPKAEEPKPALPPGPEDPPESTTIAFRKGDRSGPVNRPTFPVPVPSPLHPAPPPAPAAEQEPGTFTQPLRNKGATRPIPRIDLATPLPPQNAEAPSADGEAARGIEGDLSGTDGGLAPPPPSQSKRPSWLNLSGPNPEPAGSSGAAASAERGRAAASRIVTPAPSKPIFCPKCGVALVNPESLGLCPKCGYCRSLVEGEDQFRASAAGIDNSRLQQPDLFQIVTSQYWMIPTAALATLVIAYAASTQVVPGAEEQTIAIWAAGFLLGGAVVVFLAQLWLLVLLTPLDDRMGGKDLFFPFRLWTQAVARLALTRWAVALAGCGGALILSALLFPGGLTYWLRAAEKGLAKRQAAGQPSGQGVGLVERPLRQAAAQLEKDAAKSAVYQSAYKDFGADKSKQGKDVNEEHRGTTQCVIVGYLPEGDEEGGIGGIVLATLREGKLAYAGTIRAGLQEIADLRQRLTPLNTTAPLLPGSTQKAVWVKPNVYCEVQHFGVDESGRLKFPSFKALLAGE